MTTFFTAIGILCGICGVLAFLLAVADRYLNNYGPCTITINKNEKLEVVGGDSLLGSLSAEKIFIPSACGGRGSCGLCKLKVMDGGPPLLPTEAPHLTKEETDANVRLSCQLKVRNDMAIEIPEALFSIKEYRAEVVSIRDLTHDIKLLRLALKEPSEVSFTPGQYIQLECPRYKMNPEPVYRAYSIASAPEDRQHLETIIRLVPKGICTTWVFEYLTEGHAVTVNGPYGDFRLHDGDGEMIFIAGGSGMAPFCSILAEMKRTGNPRKVTYFFGAVSKRDLFHVEEMRAYEAALPGFTFVPALSAPTEADAWDGETGLITEVVGRHYDDCGDQQGYLCGSPGMIDACIKVLTDHGMPDENIFYDKFA